MLSPSSASCLGAGEGRNQSPQPARKTWSMSDEHRDTITMEEVGTVSLGRHRSQRRGCGLAGAGVPAETPPVIAMTDAHTYRAHLVTDAAAAAGRAHGGRYISVCGMDLLPASLATPETSYCRSCAYWHRHGGMRLGGEGRPTAGAGMVARWTLTARIW